MKPFRSIILQTGPRISAKAEVNSLAHWLLLILICAVLVVMVSENKRQDNLVSDYTDANKYNELLHTENALLRQIIEAQQERIKALEAAVEARQSQFFVRRVE